MGKNLLLYWLLFGFLQNCTSLSEEEDMFSSTSAMQDLFEKELKVSEQLEEYLKHLDKQIEQIDRYLNTHYKDFNYTESDAKDYVSNPINAYLLLKRTSLEWPRLKNTIFNSSIEDDFQKMLNVLESFPGVDNIEGAANGIFLLQETYNLNISEFSKGLVRVPGTENIIQGNHRLYPRDLEILGKLAYNKGFYDRAIEWMEEAEKQVESSGNKEPEYLTSLKKTIEVIKRSHDQALVKKGAPRGDSWRTYVVPFDPELAKKKRYREALAENGGFKSYKMKPKILTDLTKWELWDQFNTVCRGEKVRTPEQERNLTCFYLHHGDPYLRLGPFKLEVMSEYPFLGVFRNFLYDDEIDNFKDFASTKLERSRHSSAVVDENKVSFIRTSKQAWLHENESNKELNDVVRKVTDRIQEATRFKVVTDKGGEPYQVANYGIGGVYNAHSDAGGEHRLSEHWKEHGDRVATIMGYLTDVQAGGNTGFPVLGTFVAPQKGSVVFWYNSDKNGKVDFFTRHGGCPVLAGNKWITNKWVRYYWQMDTFTCTKTRNNFEYFNTLSNKGR